MLTTAYDTMGRPASLIDQVDNTHWVSNVQYDFAGRMTNLSYMTGNGSGSPSAASETRTYNASTGQLASLAWTASGISGGIQYAYSATQNNGQVTQATDTVSGETIVYQYDALKRLISASSNPINGSTPTAWTQAFQYDGFGNLTAKVLNGTTNSIPVNAPTNQLSNANYDANGNMTSGVGATLTYDEANRMVTAQEVSGGKEYYGYDAANKRVYRVTSSRQEQITFYGAFGEKLGVYGIQAGTCDYYYIYPSPCVSGVTPLSTSIWFGGRLLMDSGNGVVQDRLGTNRVSGARFYPYGDEITSTTNDREKFATYTRDSYTGLDYADQRFYANTYGRFNTSDPYRGSARAWMPMSWNRYAYCHDDPINCTDPTGLVDWSQVGLGGVQILGGVAGAITLAGAAAGTGGASITVTTFFAMLSAGAIANGVGQVLAGFSAPQTRISPSTAAAITAAQRTSTPGGLIAGVVSGGNQTAIQIGSIVSTALSAESNITGLFSSGTVSGSASALVGLVNDGIGIASDGTIITGPVNGPPTVITIADTLTPIDLVPSQVTQDLTLPNSFAGSGSDPNSPTNTYGITPFECQIYDINNFCQGQN